MADAFTLGQSVTWDRWNELQRRQLTIKEPGKRTVWRKTWQSARDYLPHTTAHSPEPQWRTGVVVGLRTIQNGVLHWGSEDEPTVLDPDEYVPAVLIAWNLHRTPVYVSPELVHPTPDPT